MSEPTIRKYRKAWALAIADGFATDVKPGDEITLPEVEWQLYFNPKLPNLGKRSTPARRDTSLAVWDESAWDGERINESERLVKMADLMWDQLDGLDESGIEGQTLTRIGQSIIDFVSDENKARGIARMLHSMIEFTSAYRSQVQG